MNADNHNDIFKSFGLNTHQTLWDESTKINGEGEGEQQLKRRLTLSAAILGHYRAFSACNEKEQKTLKAIAQINQEWQTLKQISFATNSEEKSEEFRKSIIEKNKYLVRETLNKGLPSIDEVKKIMKIDDIPVSRFRRLWHFIKSKALLCSRMIFGRNHFLFMPFNKRQEFSRVLDNAERGQTGSQNITIEDIAQSVEGKPGSHSTPVEDDVSDYHLKFSEHRVENPTSKHILEMMKIAKKNSNRDTKNIIIYVGGRTDNYAYSIKGILNQFWALDSIDQFWHINPRHVSLSASQTSPNYDDLINDVELMYQDIKKQEPNSNITLYGMCAGSPAACAVAEKHNEKFYSDRSFVNLNDVMDVQFDQNKWYLKALSFILYPIKAMRKLYFNLRHYNIDQSSTYKSIPLSHRDLHVIMPPKSTHAKHDSMTLGSYVSLHKAKPIKEEDKLFDAAFIQTCQTLLQKDLGVHKKRVWLQAVKDDNDIEQSHKDLLENILMWHKDRKSFLPEGSKLNPHIAYPSMLTARFNSEQKSNPLWRLNMHGSHSIEDGDNLIKELENDHMKTLAKLACPMATTFSDDMKNLDESIAKKQSITVRT